MKKFREFFVNSFFFYLAIELVEEVIEDLIAVGISSLLIKGISTFLVVSLTQGTKVVIKRTIKKITYKEGNDKMSKLKSFFQWIWANKCTLGGIGVGALTVISGTGVIDVSALPELLIGTFNITPIIYYGVLGLLAVVCAFFPETWDKFQKRIEASKSEKEAKAIQKEAKKEIAEAQKLANQTQAEQEKAQAKAEADAQAKAEKEKAEAEHRAKVEEAKAKLLAEAKANEKTGA